ncbi:PilW family protein [Pseudoalteromonas sp. T1lg65]|uniref:PilW family protein n=1 Tax=Pseudoalteromonas sp. T1lg65 TaxID=2077101 RepID=UPI003F78E2C6
MSKVRGFTLLELMISMFIGLLLLGGIIATYISMQSTTRDTMHIGELQETGRLALSIFRRDIEQVGFWGTFYDEGFTEDNQSAEPNPNADCTGGLNNGSFPNSQPTNFRPIHAELTTNGAAMNCINNARTNSEVLQVKFLEGNPAVSDPATLQVSGLDRNRYYFIAQQEQADFRAAQNVGQLPSVNATVWPYSHHVYYLSEERNVQVDDRNVTIPVLRRRRLTVNGGMTDELVIEGVEQMHFLFGLDTDLDGRVDMYATTQTMSEADWERTRGILFVQIFLLVRTLSPDADLNLQNQTYVLGHGPNKRTFSFNDTFRRTVFTTTVSMHNMGAISWSI